ncbi:MAG: hypothetical protein J6580_01005 [Gilliamella sp.]|uniref:hypothetical protein n=1 Tax=Gilliamella TaxID=1193503 RepID=UPI000A14CA5E|nr:MULTISPECIES: hypothetical protein [Gilliamella]MCO6549237.1 hypothetical protein [Gilliamella sp.]
MQAFTPINPDLIQHYLYKQCVNPISFIIECIYSKNGHEYQGTGEELFVKTCNNHRIHQEFTKLACPQTNGKAQKRDTIFNGNVE